MYEAQIGTRGRPDSHSEPSRLSASHSSWILGAMEIFELIQAVLREELVAIDPNTAQGLVRSELERLSDSYRDLEQGRRPDPSYSTPEARIAYIYKYTTCHANIVASKIWQVPELRSLFEAGGWVDMTAVGGGPGSDFLGVVKHMIATGASGGLRCHMLDREPGWGDTWSGVEKNTADLAFRVSTHFQALDVTKPGTWFTQRKHLAADLFTFIYFVSEVFRAKDAARDYFAQLMTRAKSGSLFLFVDNDRPSFYGWFDELAQEHSLVTLYGASEITKMPTDEEKRDLEPYRSWLNHEPKLSASIAWRVYRKP